VKRLPQINLQIRASNQSVIEFINIGFAMDDVVSMGKRLEHGPYNRQCPQPKPNIKT
jgi:hypothetical protein